MSTSDKIGLFCAGVLVGYLVMDIKHAIGW